MSNSFTFLFVCYWHSHFNKNFAVFLRALNTQLRFVFAMMEDFMVAILWKRQLTTVSKPKTQCFDSTHTLSRVCFIAFDPSNLKTFFFLVPMNIAFFFEATGSFLLAKLQITNGMLHQIATTKCLSNQSTTQ